MECRAYEVQVPWSRYYVAACRGANADDRLISETSRSLGLSAVVLRLRDEPDPCQAALYYMYAAEDYAMGEGRLREPSLRALLYATRSRQVSEAIRLSRGGDVVLVVSYDRQKAEEAIRQLGLEPPEGFAKAACSPDGVSALASFRLGLLIK